jgi:hypothetical protein
VSQKNFFIYFMQEAHGRNLHQEKKNMPTIFRLGARAIGTCLVLLAAAWQSIGKWAIN